MPLCITFSNIAWQTRQKSRARGSIALKAALDCEYCLSKNESIVKLSNACFSACLDMASAETVQASPNYSPQLSFSRLEL